MSLIPGGVFIFYLMLLVDAGQLLAQEQEGRLAEAVKISQEGYHEEADLIFCELEAVEQKEYSFLIARGYNFSWWGKYQQAKADFNKVLKEDPKNIDAIIGLAYTTSWAAEYAAAVHIFQRAIKIDANNRSAHFGLTYNYLQSQNIEGARYSCNQLLKKFAHEAEAHYLDGLVALRELDPQGAKRAFKSALEIDPGMKAAGEQLGRLTKSPGKVEVEGWYGVNQHDQGPQHGVRRLHAQYLSRKGNLLYLLYDNSLILDNSFLAGTERVAPYYALGGKYRWTDRLFTKLEWGLRTFTNIPTQKLVNIEQNYFFPFDAVGKLILQFDDRQVERLFLAGIAFDFGVSKYFRLEASVYHNDNLTIANHYNQRYQISAKIYVNNIEFLAGGYYDFLNQGDVQMHQPAGVFFLSSFPVIKNLSVKLFFNYDRGLFENENTVGALGLNYRLK